MNWIAGIMLALLATMTATSALAGDCDVLIAATIAGAKTPHTSIVTMNGKPTTNSVIQTQTNSYVQDGGKWHVIPMTAQQRLERVTANFKTAKMTCKKVGADTINGEPVTVYANHLENEGVVADSKVWVSAKGLPLKTENHPQEGQASVTMSDYAHFAPPPGVK